jgi:hypothetical protein
MLNLSTERLFVTSALEVGATLSVVGEDGEIVAAPNGEHELESGEIVRTEEGVIVEILEAEPVDAEEEEEKIEEEMSAAPFDADSFKEELLRSSFQPYQI